MEVKSTNANQKYHLRSSDKIKLEFARKLWREMMPANKILRQELRGNRLVDHFEGQQVIQGFIVDFYYHAAGLVIELDGSVHDGEEQMEYDANHGIEGDGVSNCPHQN